MGQKRGTDASWPAIGSWVATGDVIRVDLDEAMEQLDHHWTIVTDPSGDIRAVRGGQITLHGENCTASGSPAGIPVLGMLAPTPPRSLGSAHFLRDHGTSSAYVAGSMANGIASVPLVTELAQAGYLSFYGAAGQSVATVHAAILQLKQQLPDRPWGCNLIHSPAEPSIEDETSRLLVKEQVPCVEVSAYLDITEPLVRLRLQGVQFSASSPLSPCPRLPRVMAKASRLEVARKFLSPAPEAMVEALLRKGEITVEQAQWARQNPLCDDLTAEADSGGHTDNRPMTTLVPAFAKLRSEIAQRIPAAAGVQIGAAGGLGTPEAICAALALGADYVVIGSVHQACVESGSSDVVREMLAAAGPADVIMAPASDMFELGVHLQVLRTGTMFGPRARKLLELYRSFSSIEELPTAELERLEKEIFRMPVAEVWEQTRQFFLEREPGQLERASGDPHHRMALLFRWYLGLSSDWANSGDPQRKLDYQIWCGPAMGAFNEWTRGSWLENPTARRVADVADTLMHGAALTCRRQDLSRQGIPIPPGASDRSPRRSSDLKSDTVRFTT